MVMSVEDELEGELGACILHWEDDADGVMCVTACLQLRWESRDDGWSKQRDLGSVMMKASWPGRQELAIHYAVELIDMLRISSVRGRITC